MPSPSRSPASLVLLRRRRPTGDAAQVDDVGRISKREFNHWYWSSRRSRSPARRSRSAADARAAQQGRPLKQQVMQFLVSSDWIVGEAKERGLTASADRDPAPVQADQEAVVPEREGLPELPADVRPDASRTCSSACGSTCSRTRSARTSRRARSTSANSEIKDYYNKNEQQFSQPERRDLEVDPDQDPGQGERRPSSSVESGAELGQGGEEALDRPGLQEPGRQAARRHQGPAGPDFRRARSSRAVKGKIAGPVKTGAGYYVFRVTKVTPGDEAEPRSSRTRASGSCWCRRTSRRSSTSSRPDFRNEWRAQDRLRQGLRDPRLPQRP